MTSSSSAREILNALQQAGVVAQATPDGNLRLTPRHRVPADLIPTIQAAKNELVALLQNVPLEHVEAAALAARMAADRTRLRELLLEAGRRRGWPRIQLAPWMWLQGGEEGWRRYLDCPAHGPDEYRQLLDALTK
jgi:hypothetical protein